MEWLYLVILSSALLAINNIFDKYFLHKLIKNPTSYQMTLMVSGFITLPILFVIFKIPFIYPWSILAISLGIITTIFSIIYNKAVMLEEISRVVSMSFITPIFIMPLAYFFLGEALTYHKYLGVMLLVASAILVSYRKTKEKIHLSPALVLILITVVVLAMTQTISKHILSSLSPIALLLWTSVGGLSSFSLLFLLPKVRSQFIDDIKKSNLKQVVLLRLIGIANFYIGLTLFFIALSKGAVSIVSAVTSVQPFFVLIYAILVTRFAPWFVKENLDKNTLFLKFISVILMFVGTWFVAI